MTNIDFGLYAKKYKSELLDNVIPFWMEHSIDKEFGGYFTCLERDGSVFDTDKFIWLQARQVWMFAKLYNDCQKNEQWLDVAVRGGEFLLKYGHDGDYNWYFSLTREGDALVEPYNIFSYAFATMAFGQLAKAIGEEKYADVARKSFELIRERRNNPKGRWTKTTNARPLKGLSLPMIMSNLVVEIEHIISKEEAEAVMSESLDEVLNNFYKPDLGLVLECVSPDNELVDSFEGRLINPGHAIESMWFLMDLGVRLGRKEVVEKANDIALQMLEYGWDKEHGGIY